MKKSIKEFLINAIYSQNWNIGFTNDTPEEVIHKKKISKIIWLKHPYKDRWFADPFVVKEDDKEIVVFVEELVIASPKGYLTELHVDRISYKLLSRYVLLELDTHLSFPAFYYIGNELYVYPENGASGHLDLYKYDVFSHSLVYVKEIVSEALVDAIMVQKDGCYLMFATRSESAQHGVYLFESNQIDGPYCLKEESCFDEGVSRSRSAGKCFDINGVLYRPVQDCAIRYGGGVNIMKVDLTHNVEDLYMSISPNSWRYNLGMHTLNFGESVCVVDGYGYLYPLLGRLYYSSFITNIKKIIRK
jgi:hypothetical protein